jgi:cytoskeleton protein RodZ
MKNEVKNESDTPRKTPREVGASTSKNLRVVEDKAKKDTAKELPAIPHEKPSNVGHVLKYARQKANISLDEVSWNLRISKIYLEAIEDSRSDALLERVYTLGFVRSYAAYLGLNADEIVGRFKAEVFGDHQFEPLVFLAPEAEASSPRGTIILLSSMVALLCIGGWYMYSHQSEAPIVKEIPSELQKAINQDLSAAEGAVEAPSAPLKQSGEHLVTSAPTASNEIEDARPAEEGDSVDTPEEAVKMPAGLSSETSLSSALPVGQTPQHAPALVLTQPEAVQPASNSTPANSPNALAEVTAPMMVALTFVERCWVEVRDANQRILIQKSFNKGDSYKIEAKVGRKLSLGNAGGVRISVNQSSPVAIGGTGMVERISLDPENLSKYSGAQR